MFNELIVLKRDSFVNLQTTYFYPDGPGQREDSVSQAALKNSMPAVEISEVQINLHFIS